MTWEIISLKTMNRTQQTRLDVSDAFTYDDLPVVEPVEIKAIIYLKTTGLNVTGVYQAICSEPCDRCLAPFERRFDNRFEEHYVYDTLVDNARSGELELHQDDFYDTLNPDEDLDLKDLIRQHLIMALSHDRVCNREGCSLAGFD